MRARSMRGSDLVSALRLLFILPSLLLSVLEASLSIDVRFRLLRLSNDDYQCSRFRGGFAGRL